LSKLKLKGMRNDSIKRLLNIVRDMKSKSYSHMLGMSYNDQLKTKEWRYFRLYIIVAKGCKCELCNYSNFFRLQVHHKYYINGKMAWEYELKDLMLLCRHHHKLVHKPEINDKIKGVKSIKQILNG